MSNAVAPGAASNIEVTHWYDFICPFCYVAQARNRALRSAGATLVQRPFEAHPETPPGGRHVGPRSGADVRVPR